MRLNLKLLSICFICTVSAAAEPTLSINPREAFIGDTTSILVEGVNKRTEVTVLAWMRDDFGVQWQSNATFVSDSWGRVDVGATAPITGQYSGYDGMGLFWSMVPVNTVNYHWGATLSGQAEQRANDLLPFATNPIYCWNSQTTSPLVYNFGLFVDGDIVANSTFTYKRIYDESINDPVHIVSYDFNGQTLQGTYVVPKTHDSRPLPCVIVLEDAGIPSYSRVVAPLASKLKCVVFALAYYGGVKQRTDPVNISLEYFKAAIEFMGSLDDVDPTRIALFGTSRGGEAALAVAAAFPDLVAAVVASVASGIAFENAWTLNQVPLPSLKESDADTLCLKLAQEGNPDLYQLSRFYCMLANHSAAAAAEIQVENIRCPILFQSSGYDLFWPSSYLTQVSINRLNRLPPSSPSSSSPPPTSPVDFASSFSPSAPYFWSRDGAAPDGGDYPTCAPASNLIPHEVHLLTSVRLRSLNGLGGSSSMASASSAARQDGDVTDNVSRPLFAHVDYYGAGHTFLPPYMPTSGYANRCWRLSRGDGSNVTFCSGGSSDVSIAAAMVDWFGQQINFFTSTIIAPPPRPQQPPVVSSPFDVLDKKVLLACCVGFVLLSVVLTGMFLRLRHKLKHRTQRYSRQLTHRFIS